jgi:putative peptidoglycan lipid II flippase
MSLLRSIATVGGYTSASRVLGFIRDILIARLVGTGIEADAFFVSQRLPNLFRSLFAEGAFNAAFVPLHGGHLEGNGRAAARRFAEEALSVMMTALLVLTAIAQAGMPWLIYILAGGFASDPAKFVLAVLLSQITFPYLLFVSLTALQGGILNTLHRYGHAAAAPILLNIVMIAALVFVAPHTSRHGEVLASAMTIAGVGQLIWMAYACHRAGVDLHLRWPKLTPEVKRLLRLMAPGVIGSGVMQINLVIGTQIASWQDSAVSYLYYADRIYQLPLAVIATAAGVVLLPELTRRLRAGQNELAMAATNRGIEFVLLLTLPAAVALVVIPGPIVSVLFERGAMSTADSAAIARVLAIYGLGLPAFALVKALTPSYYAREDTTTPFRFAVISMVVNTALSAALFMIIGYAGIALATVLASWLNIALLFRGLRSRKNLTIDSRLRGRLPRVGACSVIMGGVLWLAAGALSDALAGSLLVKGGALALLVMGGLASFGVLALLFGVVQRDDLSRAFRRQ